MTERARQVLAQAMGRSPMERAGLVEGVLSGFGSSGWAEIDGLRPKEAEDRVDVCEGPLVLKAAAPEKS